MFVLDRTKKPTLSLNRKPNLYAIRIFRLNSPEGNVIIWENFSNEMAKIFNLQEKSTYSILKNVAVYGHEIQFGEYTRDVALTIISIAISICCKYKIAIKLDFGAIKL